MNVYLLADLLQMELRLDKKEGCKVLSGTADFLLELSEDLALNFSAMVDSSYVAQDLGVLVHLRDPLWIYLCDFDAGGGKLAVLDGLALPLTEIRQAATLPPKKALKALSLATRALFRYDRGHWSPLKHAGVVDAGHP